MGEESNRPQTAGRLPTALSLITAALVLVALGVWQGSPVSSAATAPPGTVPALEPATGSPPPAQEVVDVDLGALYWNDVYKNTLTLQNNCNKTERVQIDVPWGGTADNNLPGMWLWLDGSPMGFRVWHDLPPKSNKSLDVEVMPLGAISRTYQRNPGVSFVDTRPTYPESMTVNGQIIVTYTGSSLCKPKTKTFNFHAVFRQRPSGDTPDER